MNRKGILFFLMFLISFFSFTITVNADTGPKPSVRIQFENMGNEVCYGTLLSKTPSTGPASTWDGVEEHKDYFGLDPEIWEVFVNYEDSDGFYFLQWTWFCSETKSLNWLYYPPNTFKVLLYYPESNRFVESEICEKYAFDSYFTIDMSNFDIDDLNDNLKLSPKKSYDYTWEMISLACRVVVTIVLEIVIALIFGFRSKKQLLLIGVVNIVTQIVLNVALNISNYYQGYFGFVLNYLFWELIVFIIETVIYVLLLEKASDKKIRPIKSILYSFTSNAVSFAIGLALAMIIPGIF